MKRRSWISVGLLLLTALPLAAHEERKVILVIADTQAGKAYIPEGTVLPPGLVVRAEVFQTDARAVGRGRGGRLEPRELGVEERHAYDRAAVARLKAGAPLVFEYAPAERFIAVRTSYEAQRAKRRSPVQGDSSHRTCYDTYIQQSNTGQYGTYYNGFTDTFCLPSSGLTVGGYYLWEFGATGDETDDDQWINPYVYVDDLNGNYECFNEAYGYTWPLSCSDGATTQWLQQGCLNTVDTGAVLYKIEYLPGYVENYLGFSFNVEHCTYFY